MAIRAIAAVRLFEPLGMRDSYFMLPPGLRERRVYRAPGMPATLPMLHVGIDSAGNDEIDAGLGGAASTAFDLNSYLAFSAGSGLRVAFGTLAFSYKKIDS